MFFSRNSLFRMLKPRVYENLFFSEVIKLTRNKLLVLSPSDRGSKMPTFSIVLLGKRSNPAARG